MIQQENVKHLRKAATALGLVIAASAAAADGITYVSGATGAAIENFKA